MHGQGQDDRNISFATGLIAGAVVGAGLMLWLAPRMASELRARVTTSARKLKEQTSDAYQQAAHRIDRAVDDVTRKVEGIRDIAAESVARGAREVERVAVAAATHQDEPEGARR